MGDSDGAIGHDSRSDVNIGLTVNPGEGGGASDVLDTPVQWSPANALGPLLLWALLLAAVLWMAHQRTRQEKA